MWIKSDEEKAKVELPLGTTIHIHKDRFFPRLRMKPTRVANALHDMGLFVTETEGLTHPAVIAVDEDKVLVVTANGYLYYKKDDMRQLCWEICEVLSQDEPLRKARKLRGMHHA